MERERFEKKEGRDRDMEWCVKGQIHGKGGDRRMAREGLEEGRKEGNASASI